MESYSLCFFTCTLVLLLFLLPVHTKHTVSSRCHDDERFAMLQFKETLVVVTSTNISADPSSYPKFLSWKSKGENSTKECCSWHGVTCDEDTGHVTGLDLSSSYLFGSINSTSSLFRLVHLQSLNLADNHFNHSSIPSQLGHLSKLTYLNLSFSRFSGHVPIEISQLSMLSSLDLSTNRDLDFEEKSLRMKGSNFRILVQNLTNIKELSLKGVYIFSAVPEILANLSSLTTLNLKGCRLFGEFPTRIFHLPNLEYLNVNYNKNLTGHLPEFHTSNTLKYLWLYDTSFSGMLPSSLVNLTQLIVLDLSSNNFVGHIHRSIGNLTNLTALDLSYNNLEGPIPSSLYQLKSLEILGLQTNRLSGIVDLDMFLMFRSLSQFALSNNNFSVISGTSSNTTFPQFDTLALDSCKLSKFPELLQNQSKLSYLSLADNILQGLIPRWIYNTSTESLSSLYLDSNSLTGFEQPLVFNPHSKLKALHVNNNKLRGSLPVPPPSIVIYNASSNSLTGEISPWICSLSSLQLLDVSANNLSGELPRCPGNFSNSMSILKLKGNKLRGTIPHTWANGYYLRMLDMSQNQFQGQLPRSLANCTMLEFLDVGNNQIKDTFPSWLGTLPRLKLLVLQFNRFYGAIKDPQNRIAFPELQIIGLSHNCFSGHLPSAYFNQWKAMTVLCNTHAQPTYMKGSLHGDWGGSIYYSFTIINKGTYLEYLFIQSYLKLMDLSCNKFEGQIPELLGNLQGLGTLNLSNNILTGPIPSSLGNLSTLDALDLSHNKLSGEIPPQLTQLNFLGSFSVAHNHLSGSIPHGKQFDTFSSNSYEGNVGLCGFPLPKECGKSLDSPPPTSTVEQKEGFSSEFDWKPVVIGCGCGLVIGIVVGHIAIEKRPDWFFMTFGIRLRK